MTLLVGKFANNKERNYAMAAEGMLAHGGRPSSTRDVADALWDKMQAALVKAIQEEVLPASVFKGGPAKLAAHLGAMLTDRKEEVIRAVLLANGGRSPSSGLLPALDFGFAPSSEKPRGPLGVRFTHACRALGCNDRECGLCRNNPHKRCRGPEFFSPKYLIGDVLLARCGAPIGIELYDTVSGQALDTLPADRCTVELFVVSGATAADAEGHPVVAATSSRGSTRAAAAMASLGIPSLEQLLSNQEGKPLLSISSTTPAAASSAAANEGSPGPALGSDASPAAAATARHDSRGAVAMTLKTSAIGSAAALLPALTVTDSSEALLSGRKATFRLVAKVTFPESSAAAAPGEGTGSAGGIRVMPGISPAFVVATRRIKSNLKQEIPLVSDPVAKLDQVGKQTADKLADLETAAATAKPPVSLPLSWDLRTALAPTSDSQASGDICVTTVGQLRTLMEAAEHDAGPNGLKRALCKVLKMTPEHWARTLARVEGAVDIDERPRKWYPLPGDDGDESAEGRERLGVVFPAKQGCVELIRPLGLVSMSPDGSEHATLASELSSSQRGAMARLLRSAAEAWAAPQHPGWEACEPAVAAALNMATAAAGRRGNGQPLLLRPAGSGGSADSFLADGGGGGGGGGLAGLRGVGTVRLDSPAPRSLTPDGPHATAVAPAGSTLRSGRAAREERRPVGTMSPMLSAPEEAAAAAADESDEVFMPQSATPGSGAAAAGELMLPAQRMHAVRNGHELFLAADNNAAGFAVPGVDEAGGAGGGMGGRDESFGVGALNAWLLNGSMGVPEGAVPKVEAAATGPTTAAQAAAAAAAMAPLGPSAVPNDGGGQPMGIGPNDSQELSFIGGMLGSGDTYPSLGLGALGSLPGASLGLGGLGSFSMGLGSLGAEDFGAGRAASRPMSLAAAAGPTSGPPPAAAAVAGMTRGGSLEAALADPLSSFRSPPARSSAVPLAGNGGGFASGTGFGGLGGATGMSMLEEVNHMAGQKRRALEASADSPALGEPADAPAMKRIKQEP